MKMYLFIFLMLYAQIGSPLSRSLFAANARNIEGSPVPKSSIKTLALLPFENDQNLPDLACWKKAIPEMLTTILSTAPGIVIVEREKVQALLKEVKFNMSAFVDQNTAQEIGKLMGAEYIMIGSFLFAGNNFRIDARIEAVETGLVVKAVNASKKIQDFGEVMDIIDILAKKIVDELDVSLKKATALPKIRERETNSLKAANEFYTGLDFFDRDRFDKAIEHFVQSIKYDPNYEKAHNYLVLAYEQNGQASNLINPFDLVKLYQTLIAKFPQNPVFHNYLGRACAAKGDLHSAEREYKTAISIKPQYATPYNNLGDLYFREGNYRQALKFFKKSKELKLYDTSITENNLGLTFTKLGHYDDAEIHFANAISEQPLYYEAYFNLGNLYMKEKKYEKSINEFQTAITLKSDFLFAKYNMGLAYFNLGKIDSAKTIFMEILQKDGSFYNAKLNLASILIKEHHFYRADSLLNELNNEGIRDPLLFENMGVIALAHSDTLSAVSDFQKALALDSHRIQSLVHLARLLFKQGDTEAAGQLLSKEEDYTKNQPQNLVLQFYLIYASILEKSEHYKKALAMFNRALLIDPKCFKALLGQKRNERLIFSDHSN